MLPTRAVKGNAGTRTVQIVQYRRFQTDSINYFLNMYRKESNARMCRPFFLHKVCLDKSIIKDSILNGYKTICLGVAFSEIFGSPELRKREHENKTFSFFPPRPFSRTFYFLVLPTIREPEAGYN